SSGTATGTGGHTGSGGHTTTMVTTTTDTTSTTDTTTTSTTMSCNEQCIAMHGTEFTKFEGYLLKECGCSGATASPCMGTCTTADCGATMPSQVSQACQTCLATEGGKGLGSTCAVKAATGDCAGDTMCKAFSDCALCCATQGKAC